MIQTKTSRRQEALGFHAAWSACVGMPGYNKRTWIELEGELEALSDEQAADRIAELCGSQIGGHKC